MSRDISWENIFQELSGENRDHIVQFYEGETFLLDTITRFVIAGLENGEGVMIIASAEHSTALDEQLTRLKIDAEGARIRGQLVILDANETLEKFMVGHMPNEELFEASVGKIVEETIHSFPVLRAYGEMVNILWSEGNLDGTIALEELWNKLAESRSFSILCGYMLDRFKNEEQAVSFRDICKAHTHVMPVERSPFRIGDEIPLNRIAQLQHQAASLETEINEKKEWEGTLAQHEKELSAAREETRMAILAKNSFLREMSHEIRTPLVAILGFSELLMDKKRDPEEAAECAEVIIRNAKRLNEAFNVFVEQSKTEPVPGEVSEPLCLPATLERPSQEAPPQGVPPALKLKAQKMLIVEDSPDSLHLICRILKNAGAEVSVAENGQAGLEKALADNYDAIILDIHMPIMDGYGVIRELRTRGYRMPVIALTAHALNGDREKCLKAGFTDHIGKPFDREFLVDTLGNALKAHADRPHFSFHFEPTLT